MSIVDNNQRQINWKKEKQKIKFISALCCRRGSCHLFSNEILSGEAAEHSTVGSSRWKDLLLSYGFSEECLQRRSLASASAKISLPASAWFSLLPQRSEEHGGHAIADEGPTWTHYCDGKCCPNAWLACQSGPLSALPRWHWVGQTLRAGLPSPRSQPG
jgi:hypothetical protein